MPRIGIQRFKIPTMTSRKAQKRHPKAPVAEEREITLDQAIELVRTLLSGKQYEQAEYMLTSILRAMPEEPSALPLLGALRNIQGRHDEALALMKRSIELVPDEPGRWNDLGLVYRRLNRFDEAREALQHAATLAGNTLHGANALDNLGRQQMLANDPVAAERSFRRAVEIKPDEGFPWYGLSQALVKMDRIAESVDASGQAIVLLPQYAPREHMIRALIHLGRTDEAIERYREWLREEPGNPVLEHHLRALTHPDTNDGASDAYVEKVFDGFASSFDSTLATLEYHAPDLITEALARVYPDANAQLDIADAGCGTGLCGPLVQPWAKRLCGFDLSGGMLELADARKVYSDLHKVELVSFLAAHPAEFDVLVCADTLCYFAGLHPAMAAIHAAVRPGGHIFYTVEVCEDDNETHRLLPSGRYAHSLMHVTTSATCAGLRVMAINRVTLRNEAGRPVVGWLVTLSRP